MLNNPLKYTDPTGENYDNELDGNGNSIYGGGGTNAPTYYVDGVQVSSAFAGAAMIGAENTTFFGSSAAAAQGSNAVYAASENQRARAGWTLTDLDDSIRDYNTYLDNVALLPGFSVTEKWEDWYARNYEKLKDVIGWELAGQRGKNELGPIGLGLSIEIGFPKWLVGDTEAFGFDIGFVADNTLTGIGLYITTKTPVNNPVAFSIAPEVFYAHSSYNNQIKISSLQGGGMEITGSVGNNGGSYGVNNERTYQMFTVSGFSKGIDFGSGTWETNTSVYTLDMLINWINK